MATDLTGARLDAAVELAIFGGTIKVTPGSAVREHADGRWTLVKRYSESLDDAWFVVQEMRKRGYDFVLSADGKDLWYCSFAPPPARPSSSARAEMVTWAICWAALNALD
jgi:hypothetical protein